MAAIKLTKKELKALIRKEVQKEFLKPIRSTVNLEACLKILHRNFDDARERLGLERNHSWPSPDQLFEGSLRAAKELLAKQSGPTTE